MKKRMALFCTLLLLVTALAACGSAGKEAEVPPLTEVEAMTAEEAAEALSGLGRAPGRVRRPVLGVHGSL